MLTDPILMEILRGSGIGMLVIWKELRISFYFVACEQPDDGSDVI